MTEAQQKVAVAKAAAIEKVAVATSTAKKELYGTDNWQRRRKVLYILLWFHMAAIGYLVTFAPNDDLRQNLAYALTGSFASIAIAYLGLPVLDDNNKRNNIAAVESAVAAPAAEPEAE